MDLTVLERQRAVLRRLHYHNSDQMPSLSPLSYTKNNHDYNHNTSSSQTGVAPIPTPTPKPHQQCNSSSDTPIQPILSSPLKKRKAAEFEYCDSAQEFKEKGLKSEEFGEEKSEVTARTDRELSSNTCSKVSEVQKPDYIHVRARRGQATDSHSLAERARREKISKKMKCLQDLVPGCNKVIWKAGMLDEIINYVQSLQKQVEFLSMKLAAINPQLDFNIDNFFAKEIPAYLATLQPPSVAAQFEAANSICFQYPIQQGADLAMDQSPHQVLPQKRGIPGDPFLDPVSCISQQQMSGWESDWPSLFNAGFH